MTTAPEAPAPKSRAGRDLPAAIGIGVGLAALVLVTLFTVKETFIALAVAALLIGTWELRGAMTHGHVNAPLVPGLVATAALPIAAFVGGPQALMACYGLGVVAILTWRLIDGSADALRDVSGGVFIMSYVSLMAGFVALMLREDDGPQRVLVFILVTVCSDVGGYAVGVVFGKHPMAPSISPKKSWEGAAGSALFCVLGGVVSVPLMLGGSWWAGAVIGIATVVTATVGDLTESTIKRDLGIKDMGTTLPGHGGLMDRLDSLLLTVSVSWALLAVLVPAG